MLREVKFLSLAIWLAIQALALSIQSFTAFGQVLLLFEIFRFLSKNSCVIGRQKVQKWVFLELLYICQMTDFSRFLIEFGGFSRVFQFFFRFQ